jgi:hypothetical protein
MQLLSNLSPYGKIRLEARKAQIKAAMKERVGFQNKYPSETQQQTKLKRWLSNHVAWACFRVKSFKECFRQSSCVLSVMRPDTKGRLPSSQVVINLVPTLRVWGYHLKMSNRASLRPGRYLPLRFPSIHGSTLSCPRSTKTAIYLYIPTSCLLSSLKEKPQLRQD